jgi:hypothetical protein
MPEALFLAGRHDDMNALGGEPISDREAYADAATGDDRDLVAQPQIHRKSPSSPVPARNVPFIGMGQGIAHPVNRRLRLAKPGAFVSIAP